MHRSVERRQLGAGGLLELVNEDEHADAEVTGGLAEHFEQRGEVGREATGVGNAADWINLDAERQRPTGVELHGEGLEHAEQSRQLWCRVAAGRGAHASNEGLAQRDSERR